jgi:hypothetical protein
LLFVALLVPGHLSFALTVGRSAGEHSSKRLAASAPTDSAYPAGAV